MLGGEAQQKTAREVEMEVEETGGLPSMGSHRVGHDWCGLAAAAAPQRVAPGMPCRARRGSQGRVQAERQEPGPQVFLGFGVPWLRLMSLAQKSRALVSFLGVLSERHARGMPWESGTLYHNCHRRSHREFVFTWDSMGCSPGCALAWGANVNWRPPQATWAHKIDAMDTISQSSLAELSMWWILDASRNSKDLWNIHLRATSQAPSSLHCLNRCSINTKGINELRKRNVRWTRSLY